MTSPDSKLTKAQQALVRTASFKAWFGDWETAYAAAGLDFTHPAWKDVSKVVDENGEPLVVLRGEFQTTHAIKQHDGSGTYFTDNYDVAIYFGEKKSFVKKYFLNIRNPFVLSSPDNESDDFRDITRRIHASKNISKKEIGDISWVLRTHTYGIYKNGKYSEKKVTKREKLKRIDVDTFSAWIFKNRKQYDGMIIPMLDEGDDLAITSTTFIAYHSEQIKLADGTNTSFDASNPDIRYAKGGLLAPNGKPSNLTPEQHKLVRTAEFKKWFGDWEHAPETASKVVDKNGEPLVVYHGSQSKDITVFDTEGKLKKEWRPIDQYLGAHFTPNLKIAERFKNGINRREEQNAKSQGLGILYTEDDLTPEQVSEINVQAKFQNLDIWAFLEQHKNVQTVFTHLSQLLGGDFYARGFFHKLRYAVLEKPYPTIYECFLNLRNPLKVPQQRYDNGVLASDQYSISQLISGVLGRDSGLFKQIFLNAHPYDDGNLEALWKFYFENIPLDAKYTWAKNTADRNPTYEKFISDYGGSSFWFKIEDMKRYVALFKERSGCDGLLYQNTSPMETEGLKEENLTTYIAFYPEQIKLADGSNKKFDSNNPDIRYAQGGNTHNINFEQGGILPETLEERIARLVYKKPGRKSVWMIKGNNYGFTYPTKKAAAQAVQREYERDVYAAQQALKKGNMEKENGGAVDVTEFFDEEKVAAQRRSLIEKWIGDHKARRIYVNAAKPQTKEGLELADKKEDALDVIREYYKGFTESSVRRAMIETKERNYGKGRRIGIMIKAEPYAQQFSVLVMGIIGGYDVEFSGNGGWQMYMDEDAKLYSIGKTYIHLPQTADELIDDFAVLDLLACFPAKAQIIRDASMSLVYPTAKELLETGYVAMNKLNVPPLTVEQALKLYDNGTVERIMQQKTVMNKNLPPSQKRGFADDFKLSIKPDTINDGVNEGVSDRVNDGVKPDRKSEILAKAKAMRERLKGMGLKRGGNTTVTAPTWKEFQNQHPDLFEYGILRRQLKPLGAIGVIPEDVHTLQGKWQNYGQYSDIPADKVYERINSGSYKGEYVDKDGFTVRDENGLHIEDTYNEETQEYEAPTIPNEQLKNLLIESFTTKEGREYLDNVIAALPKNSDGTIIAYRIGAMGEGVQSYTLSEGMAKTFSHQGTDIMPAGLPSLPKAGYEDWGALPANIVKVNTEGIVAWSPYDAEILVDAKYVMPLANLKNKDTSYAKGGLLAPNGKKSNLTPEQWKLVRTPEFKKWFGDWENSPETASKIVDENGEPLVVYHGTKADFNSFDISKMSNNGTHGKGFYFTQHYQLAYYFGKKKNVKSVFLNMINPVIVGEKYNSHVVKDGVIEYDDGGAMTEIVVYRPNQIKLADGSNTTFDGKNADVRYAKGGSAMKRQQNQKPADYTTKKITLYHGSNRKFPAFKEDFIGEGFGENVFGYGYYFTENPDTALIYARYANVDDYKITPPLEEDAEWQVREIIAQLNSDLPFDGKPVTEQDIKLAIQETDADMWERIKTNFKVQIPPGYVYEIELKDAKWLQFKHNHHDSSRETAMELAKQGYAGFVDTLPGGEKQFAIFPTTEFKLVSRKTITPGSASLGGAMQVMEEDINAVYESGGMTHADRVKEINEDARAIRKRIDWGFDNQYATLYHGTSEAAAKKIKDTSFFRDGFFFTSTAKGEYGDSVYEYAKIRAKQAGESGRGAVIAMKVSPDSFHINVGTAEVESDGDLYLWSDNIWRNRAEPSEVIEPRLSKYVAQELQIPSGLALMLVNYIRHHNVNSKPRNADELVEPLKAEIEQILLLETERPRKFANLAKEHKLSKEEYAASLRKVMEAPATVFVKQRSDKPEDDAPAHWRGAGGDIPTEFWGDSGAGILPIAQDTGRILVAMRSPFVMEPDTWGVFGGKIDNKRKKIVNEAIREFVEETEYKGKLDAELAYIWEAPDGGFKYYNFIGVLPHEFDAEVDWETAYTQWMTLDELLAIELKHFGLRALLADKKALALIRKYAVAKSEPAFVKEAPFGKKEIERDSYGSRVEYKNRLDVNRLHDKKYLAAFIEAVNPKHYIDFVDDGEMTKEEFWKLSLSYRLDEIINVLSKAKESGFILAKRRIGVKSLDDISIGNLGFSYSFNDKYLPDFGGYGIDKKDVTQHYKVTLDVQIPFTSINLEATIDRYVYYGVTESEIVVKQDAPVKITGINIKATPGALQKQADEWLRKLKLPINAFGGNRHKETGGTLQPEAQAKPDNFHLDDFLSKHPRIAQYMEWLPIEAVAKYREFDRRKEPKWSKDYYDDVKQQIKENGITAPLSLTYGYDDGRLSLGEGNHRLAIGEDFGYTKLPVYVHVQRKNRIGKKVHLVEPFKYESTFDFKPSNIVELREAMQAEKKETPTDGVAGASGENGDANINTPIAKKQTFLQNKFTGSDIFYHGTTKQFDQFERQMLMGREAIATLQPVFFSEDREMAAAYAVAKGGRVIEVKIKAEAKIFDFNTILKSGNFIEYDLSNLTDDAKLLAAALDKNEVELTLGNLKGKDGFDIFNEYIQYGDYDVLESKGFVEWFEKNGYDGFYVREYRGTKDRNLAMLNMQMIVIQPESKSNMDSKSERNLELQAQ